MRWQLLSVMRTQLGQLVPMASQPFYRDRLAAGDVTDQTVLVIKVWRR
jgi:hypothetical protein